MFEFEHVLQGFRGILFYQYDYIKSGLNLISHLFKLIQK